MQSPLKSLLRSSIMIVALALPMSAFAAGNMKVYKSPNCGCCDSWVDHMRFNGFEVEVEHHRDLHQVKEAQGVPRDLASCHTAVIDGYVIEGHVPAADVKRLLEGEMVVAGVAVPGMPMGSPGMDGATAQPYATLSFTDDGGFTVFARH